MSIITVQLEDDSIRVSIAQASGLKVKIFRNEQETETLIDRDEEEKRRLKPRPDWPRWTYDSNLEAVISIDLYDTFRIAAYAKDGEPGYAEMSCVRTEFGLECKSRYEREDVQIVMEEDDG
jgi:hypothetical protein